MKVEITEARWLDETGELSLEELVEVSGLPSELLVELVEHGALEPVESRTAGESRSGDWHFSAECVVAVRTASRLREDFDLDANAMSVAMMLIERIHGLESQLQELQCQFPHLKKRS